MSATITISPGEMRSFQETIRRRIAVGKEDARDIVNAKALDIAYRSMANTRQADKTKIEHTLGVAGYRVSRSKKTGEFKKRGIDLIEDSFAARIVNAQHTKRGESWVFGAELIKQAKALINARVRAVTFIKSGWLPAIRKLSTVVKDARVKASAKASGVRAFGKPKGSAKAAPTGTSFPSAVITNFANKDSQRAAGLVQTGLSAGVRESIADMEVYIKRKVAESNAKVFK